MGVLPGPQLVKSALLLLFNIPCYRPIPTCHTWSFLVYFYSICFLFMVFSILELWCLDFMILVLFTTFGIPHLGIMLPRLHVPCFIYGIWILHSYSGVMLPRFYVPFSFYGMCILNYGIMLPRFHDSSFIYDICILHFGIMLPRFHDHWLFTHLIWNSTYLLYGNYVASIP